MLLDQSIVPTPSVREQEAAPSCVEVRRPSFPSAELVAAAAGLFGTERVPERVSGTLRLSVQRAFDWFPVRGDDALRALARRELVEGVRWRIEVGPGVVAVRSFDPVRAERTHERARKSHDADVAQRVWKGIPFVLPAEEHEGTARSVRYWSGKSRARMVQRLAELDFEPMFAAGGRPADVTLTLPGDWLTVAPDAATCHKLLLKLRKRYERAWERPLHAVWKREFQGRGAPHWHLFAVLPEHDLNGESVRAWFGRVWAEVVAHPDPVERARHELAGTAVDFTEGARRSDPRRLAAYFSKHGAFSAKDYQNTPPEEWGDEPVGRFWGYWYLSRAVAAVEVAPDVATSVSRTARRYAAAHRFYVQAERWRKVTTVDKETGEIGFKWRKRRTSVPVLRFRTLGGFLVVNDGPGFAAALAASAAQSIGRRAKKRSGAGPVGFLP